jgi:hypothetical protein
MRILILGINYHPERTSVSPFTTGLSEHLAAQGHSDNAVAYLPMPPCEVCLVTLNNLRLRRIAVRRIVYLEDRAFGNTMKVAASLPHIAIEKHRGAHPAELLERAAVYALLRTARGTELSANSALAYATQ